MTKSQGIMRASWLECQPRRHKKRLAAALAVSLLVHGLLLSLRFGIPGLGLPGIAMPWAERRARSTDLIVHLVEAPVAPAPGTLEIEPRVPAAREPYPNTLELRPAHKERPPAPQRAVEKPKRAAPLPSKQQPEILAVPEHQEDAFSVPAPAVAEDQRTPDTSVQEEAARIEEDAASLDEAKRQAEAARQAQELEEQRQAEKAARELVLARERQEQKRQEEARIQEQAKKKEEERAQRLALEIEARRQAEQALALAREKEDQEREAIRQEKEKAERLAQQLQARRQAEESARQAAESAARQKELEARKAEELAARQRAEELAERQRAEALARQREGERAAAAPPAASARELASRALEQLRSSGVPRTERPGARPSLEGSDSSPRRSILGSARGDIGLQMYIESWRAKIERNGNLNYPPSARNRAHEQPVVTVAIRRDGSVEDVVFHQSSGMRDLDDAVRNIVRLYAPFSTFPPDLARRYDVIEIRRVWFFGDALRILEEMR